MMLIISVLLVQPFSALSNDTINFQANPSSEGNSTSSSSNTDSAPAVPNSEAAEPASSEGPQSGVQIMEGMLRTENAKKAIERSGKQKGEEIDEVIDDENGDVEVEIEPFVPQKFGFSFFLGARMRILKLEGSYIPEYEEPKSVEDTYEVDQIEEAEAIEEPEGTAVTEEPIETDKTAAQRLTYLPREEKVQNAISGFVGPIEMMSAKVSASVPDNYILRPGDRLTVHYWSNVVEFTTMNLVIDEKGDIILPKIGQMTIRGMTLAQFENSARETLERVAFKNLKLIATLDSLRSIQIFITGEAFRPGSYNVSAVTSLFNVLYLCGGPSDNGSLRNIKLIRNGETRIIDFYKYLMQGDATQDLKLEEGDTIFISPEGRMTTILGEVKRPAIYELGENENLLSSINLANGIRPSGYLQRIRIDSVTPGSERILIDVDLSGEEKKDQQIFDGDTVTVFSIPSQQMNTVTIEGQIRMPGEYQLKDGMTISDLIKTAQWLLGDAHMERADLFRLNDDKKTTTLIPIDLYKALAGDIVHNMILNQWDKLVVYSKWDVKWTAPRIVSTVGAVTQPGSFSRADNMTVEDLLIQSGGTLPEAYLDRAYIIRLDNKGDRNKAIPINLKDTEIDLKTELIDGDILLVYTHREVKWEPEPVVLIEGAVQNPGAYRRFDDTSVSDLVQISGGLLPIADTSRALLLRLDNRLRPTRGFYIDLKLAINNDPKHNLILKDGDKLKVYSHEEARWEPERKVTIVGAVHKPGDVFIPARPGYLSTRIPERPSVISLPKEVKEEKSPFVRGSLEDIQTEETQTSLSRAQTEEEDSQEEEEPLPYIRASIFDRIDGMKVSDLIQRAGGLLPNAYKDRADLRRVLDDYETYIIIPIDLNKVLAGDPAADISLQDADLLTIYTTREAQFKPRNIVIMYGAVQRPDIYTRTIGMKLKDLLFAAGGLLPGALKDAEITRIDDDGKTKIRPVDVIALLDGDESQNVLLEDGDVVSVRKDNEYLDVLRTVEIQGEVKYPGRYAIQRDERLSDLINRAGGLTGRAYPEAAVITRSLNYLTLSEQKKSAKQVKELMEELSKQEYQREIAKATLIEQRRQGKKEDDTLATSSLIPSIGIAAAGAVSNIPDQTESAITNIEDITSSQLTLVTPARELENFLPPGRLVVNIKEAIGDPGKKDDIALEDGDKITIPTMRNTISVTGAVIQPSSLVFVESLKPKSIRDYIEMAGGFSRDADREAVYVIKANGMVVREDKAELSAGDMIIVPTKIMIQKITDRWGQVISAVKFSVTTIALVYTIRLIVEVIQN